MGVGVVYARSTTIQAHPLSIDAGIAHVRDEVMPALQAIDGCIGLSLLVDRRSGRCIATSAWQSEEAMRASGDRARPIRDRAAQIFGGNPQIDEWEIAVLHRAHHATLGACVRAVWTQGDPAALDRAIDVFKMAALPAIEQLDGFCSVSMMVDRATGRMVASTTFDSDEAMDRNRDQAAVRRTAVTKEAGLEILDVREFELALAHLRVPEMA
jgi:heme-degrading monooxygenase HmoA